MKILLPGQVGEVEEIEFRGKKMYRIIKLISSLEPVQGSYEQAAPLIEESLKEYAVDLASIQYWEQCLSNDYAIEIRLPDLGS